MIPVYNAGYYNPEEDLRGIRKARRLVAEIGRENAINHYRELADFYRVKSRFIKMKKSKYILQLLVTNNSLI